MKPRPNSLLTMFALGLTAAAFAPRILRALAGWRPVVTVPPSVPYPAPLAMHSPPVAPAPVPAAVVETPATEVEPAVLAPPSPSPNRSPEPAPYPWLWADQAAPSVETFRQKAEAAAPANRWTPVPPAAAEPLRALRPAPEAVPWNQGYQPLGPEQSVPQRQAADPARPGWAPPGTYQPPAPIPFPTGGYRPPAARYALPQRVDPAVERPPAAAPAFVPLGIPLAEAELGTDLFPRSSLWHWLGTISSLIGILLLITVAATLVFVAVAPRALGWQFVVVSGNSMEPTIQLGAIAVMKKVDPNTLRAGDIIMFTDPSQPDRAVTHRVVGVNDNGASFTTRGDANQAVDAGPVPAQDVRGKFLFSIPEAGRFIHWIGSWQGYLVLLLLCGIVISFWGLRSRTRNRASAVAA